MSPSLCLKRGEFENCNPTQNSRRNFIAVRISKLMRLLFPGNALSCKETFSLLYYEFDAATREPPPWDAERYKLVGE